MGTFLQRYPFSKWRLLLKERLRSLCWRSLSFKSSLKRYGKTIHIGWSPLNFNKFLSLFAILWHNGWTLEKTICMNMNYNYPTAIFRSILTQILCISGIIYNFWSDLEKFTSKNGKYIFFYQKFVHLGEITSKYCSRIIVVRAHETVFFSKVYPACHNIANGIKPGSNSKKTDKHAADCSKAECWGVKWSMWDVF